MNVPPPKDALSYSTLDPVNVTLRKRVLADIIKDPQMRSPWIIHVGPKSTGKCAYKRQKRRRHRNRGKCHVKTESETEVMEPKAKECLEPAEAE